ncbi:MAG: metallophosphoesterase [Sulfolobales archaeon]
MVKVVYGVDLHGNELNLYKVINVFRALRADLMILGGDINAGLQGLAEIRDKVVLLPGECDDVYVTKHARELGILFDGTAISISGCRVGFVGGLSVHQSIRKLYEGVQGTIDILVTHFPPKGCLDLVMGKYHGGLRELNDVIVRYGVKYVLTGHYHDNIGTCFLNNTLVLNPGPLDLGNYLILNYCGVSANYTFMRLP